MASKRQNLISAVFFILGLLLIFGPVYLFPVCQYKGMMIELKNGGLMPMKCSYSARAEAILGVLTITVAILLLTARQSASRQMLYGLVLIIGFLVVLVPSWLIGVCGSPMMPCRAGTLPFLELIGGSIVVSSIFGMVSER